MVARNTRHSGDASRLRQTLTSRDVLLEGRGADRVAAVGLLKPRGVPARRAVAMIALLAVLPVLVLAAQTPQAVSELRALARDGPDSVLVERLRQGPRDLREALRQLLAATGREDSVGVAALTAAEHLASAWLVAWRDSFYVRKVSRFRSLSPADRQANSAATGVLRAGNIASLSAGVDAAMPAWRESLRL